MTSRSQHPLGARPRRRLAAATDAWRTPAACRPSTRPLCRRDFQATLLREAAGIWALGLFCLALVLSTLQGALAGQNDYIEGEALVIFKPGTTADIADKSTARHHSSSVRTFESISRQRQRLHRHIRSGTQSTAALIAELKNDPDVELAEPNYRRKLSGLTVPNDAEFDKLWGLRNTGQTVNGYAGTAGADIRFIDAWGMAKADTREIVVAVLDTGIDLTHPDLAANIWTNRAEIAGDGIDNDGNGRVDDVHGYDFSNNDADPSDSGLHGSHVSGIIAGVANNSQGIVGAAYHAHIMPLKISPDGNSINTAAELAALDYVVMMKNRGVNIVAINASYGGSSNSTSERNAIQAAGDAGIVFCAAAGNESADNTSTPSYPANHRLPNMIVVAASDSNDHLASFSNYGTQVDLAAPGVDIYSTVPQWGGSQTGSLTRGTTSYDATPLVYSGTTPGVTASVYDCGLGNTADFPAAVRNNIALIQRGTLLFSDKVTHAMNAGAKAVIIYNNVAGPFSGTLGTAAAWIPALGISQADGQALLGALPATVTLTSVVAPYTYESGTSMATPYVAAAVAFAARSFPNETAAQRVARILNNVTHVASLAGQVITGGRLNLAGIVDTDANGLPDWWEMDNFGHIGVDPTADPDHDGITNLQQYLIATGQAFKLDHSTLENGQITGVGVYPPKSTAILTATANAGYVFTGWTGDAAGTANPLLMPMNSNKTVGATFRPISTVSTLAGLALSAGALSPAFSAGTLAYAVSVANTTTAMTVTPTVTDSTATVKVNGTTVTSGTASASIPLAVGTHRITVGVTAEDGTTQSTYTVTVTRLSAVSTLSSLVPSSGSLSPGFAAATMTYTANVSNATSAMTVTPSVTDATATVNVNGTAVVSDTASASIPLGVGPNTITVRVTAQDGTTQSTYTVSVTRAPSAVSTLSGLTLSSGVLSPAFAPATATYTASVANTTTAITATPTVTDSTATVRVNGEIVTSGTASASIPLVVGTNPITVGVTAQDGTTTSTYTVTVTRISTVSTLSGLTLNAGTLSPGFATSTKTYTTTVASAITGALVTPTVTDPTATVKVNGEIVASGTASAPIPLVAGFNPITVWVIAQDGTTTTTYTVTVLRLSNVSTLSSLTLSTGSLSPGFVPGTTSYAAGVAYDTPSVTVTATMTHAASTMMVNGTGLASGTTSPPIPLAVGPNPIEVKVTAQDGVTVSTYTITVTRPPLDATFTSATSVGVTSSAYTATANAVSLSLGYAPAAGTSLTVVNNTGLGFICGRFTNLAQGQAVALTYNGVTYSFIANYYGGSGNDLVLQWAKAEPISWGSNNYGQLGNNSTTSSRVPAAVTTSGVLSGKAIIAVSVGGTHSLALCADGTLAAWGYNSNGQLGNSTTTNSSVPVMVNTSGALSGKTVVAIAAGNDHSLALCSDGTVASWGFNGYGQLGSDGTSNSSVPVAVATAGVLSGKTVVAIAAGYSHSLALCSDGSVAAWGDNSYGQLGNNATAVSSVPTAVSTAGILSGKAVAAISAGSDHNLALCTDETLVAWGYNNRGQLGDNSLTPRTEPVAVSTAGGLTGKIVTAVSAGGAHSLALCSDGTVAAWGYNKSGQLGNSTKNNSSVPVAVSTSGSLFGKTVVGVAAGSSHSLAQCADGAVAAWGDNSNAQLGNDSSSNSTVPVAVSTTPLGTGGRLVAAATGSKAMHSLALVPISSNSRLAGLTVGSGLMSPVFSSLISSYTSSVPGTTASATVTPTTADPAASVTVNGTAVTSGSASNAINLGASTVNTITVVVTAQDGTTSTPYTVIIDNTPFGVWKKTTFTDPADLADPDISGDLATPAHDGITNLMKYAMALEPMSCGTTGLPGVAEQNGYLTLTYRKNKAATDVTHTVQAADDLTGITWAPATTVLSQTDPTPDGGSYWLVTVRDNVPYAGQARRFMRLQVTK